MIVTSTGFDGEYKLLDQDCKPVAMRQHFKSDDGTDYMIVGGRAPHKSSSTGRIYVESEFGSAEFFPSVLGLQWVRV